MFQGIRNVFAKRLLRQVIELATEALYSEQFDMGALVSRLSRNQGGVSLLRAYVAVQTAARLAEPLSDADVEHAFGAVCISEARSNSSAFSEILDLHRRLAEQYWPTAVLAILRGTLAHKRDDSSYAGTIYSLQHERKGPVSREDRSKYEPLCNQMAELKRQIEEEELKAWKEQDEQEYLRYKDELEARALSDEIDANEDEALELQGHEVISDLEAKLNSLLSDEHPTA